MYFSGICNLSNVSLENFYWHDELPGSVRLNAIHTGTWSQPGLTYSVTYRTKKNSSYRTLASGLLSTQAYDLDCTPRSLVWQRTNMSPIFALNSVRSSPASGSRTSR